MNTMIVDKAGLIFGKLTVLDFYKRENKKTFWRCKCECGRIKIIDGGRLRIGGSLSCGCVKGNFKDLTGMRFVRLLVLNQVKNSNSGNSRWMCLCDCGNKKEISSSPLIQGATRSCGCLARDVLVKRSTIHEKSNYPEYFIWKAMLRRCNSSKCPEFKYYGGRGIKVCDRWSSIEHFLKDMGRRPPGGTLDRIDNNGNYEPSNCRWVSMEEQSRNRRDNVFITAFGIRDTLSGWCRRKGVQRGLIGVRIRNGMSPEEAIATPVRKRTKKESVKWGK